jgi:hypothetical protein
MIQGHFIHTQIYTSLTDAIKILFGQGSRSVPTGTPPNGQITLIFV